MPNQSDRPNLPRPLYRTASSAVPNRPTTAHAGLWYDKFCHGWHDPKRKQNEQLVWQRAECKKVEWIQTVATQQAIGDPPLISQYAVRQKLLVDRLGGMCLRFQAESRFVTGLGREHPVENGFAWHPTLGTPYLPGSSIKGMLRAWAIMEEQRNLAHRILGCQELPDGTDGRVGTVILFDAIPLGPVKLEVDVMTPHYSDYYGSGDIPGDWLSPVPVPFLVVAAGTVFQFAIAPRTGDGKEHLEPVAEWLKNALQWLGAGAKTAVGYGRFEVRSPEIDQPMRTAMSVRRPRYKERDIVTVMRVEDPKPKAGKTRKWFVADDGFGGVVTKGEPPDVEIGASAQLEVASVMQHGCYNFRVPKGK